MAKRPADWSLVGCQLKLTELAPHTPCNDHSDHLERSGSTGKRHLPLHKLAGNGASDFLHPEPSTEIRIWVRVTSIRLRICVFSPLTTEYLYIYIYIGVPYIYIYIYLPGALTKLKVTPWLQAISPWPACQRCSMTWIPHLPGLPGTLRPGRQRCFGNF